MKKWIGIVIIALGVVGIAYVIWDSNSSINLAGYSVRDTVAIEENVWKLYRSIPIGDTDEVYEVIWDQKYGATKKCYCTVVFRNERSNEYKLVAPWLDDLVIEKQNTDDISFDKVFKKDVPDYRTYKQR
jgi:hypothetical protein